MEPCESDRVHHDPGPGRNSLTSVAIATDVGTFDALAGGPRDGTPVMLLHGFPQFSVQWEHQLRALGAHGYRAVAPDQRGYSPGVRPAAVDAYATGHLVDDVWRIADALGWNVFHLVGHDWGAAVAWAAATLAPERIRTLTALSVPHPGAFGRALRHDPVQQHMSRYMELFRQPPPVPENAMLADFDRFDMPAHLLDHYYRRFSAEPGLLTAALNWYRAGGFPKPAKTCVPTLFLTGDSDVAIARSGIEDTENWVAAPYRLELLVGAGHFIPEEAPETVSRLLLEHLDQQP